MAAKRFRKITEMCNDLHHELVSLGEFKKVKVFAGSNRQKLVSLVRNTECPAAIIVPGRGENEKRGASRSKRATSWEVVLISRKKKSDGTELDSIYDLGDTVMENFLATEQSPNSEININGVDWEPTGFETLETEDDLDVMVVDLVAIDFRQER